MATETVRKLADSQLQTFADTDYITDSVFNGMVDAIERDFPGGQFSFLDVGGGCGFFADRLLERFPLSTATIVDNSELLLSENTAHPRKDVVLGSATELRDRFGDRSFDVVFFNLALHHFIASNYGTTRQIQREAIAQAIAVLSPRGRVVVTENLFDGMLADNLPGFLIYTLTSNSTLAPVMRRLGANTAGVGVCFLSMREWAAEFRRLGLAIRGFGGEVWHEEAPLRELRLRVLGVRRVTRAFFWLAPRGYEARPRLPGEQ
jgi:ubiquinone/menaquinone biosynthesis C-methylase UbiE